MRGYAIFEEGCLNQYQKDGIAPYENRIGLLDFLRELRGGLAVMPPTSSFMVMGIDEVLYMAGADGRKEVSRAIRKTLQGAASELNRKNIEVQIVCKGKLVKGDSLYLEYRKETLPIDYIFGTPMKIEVREHPVYAVGFNLSS